MTSPTTLIFDVGNVLFGYYPEQLIEAILPQSTHKKLYLDCLFNAPLWQRLDRGDITEEEALETLKHTHHFSSHQQEECQQLLRQFTTHLVLDTQMKHLFETACTHYNTYILSNFQSGPFKQLCAQHPFLTRATGQVISADIRMKKPEIGIFHYLLSRFKLIPEHCLFIDDMADNITTAKQLKFHTIHHHNYKQTAQALASTPFQLL